jgi:hypothetical protein
MSYDFLNRETRKWLQSSMDLVRNAGESAARRLTSLQARASRETVHKVRSYDPCQRILPAY